MVSDKMLDSVAVGHNDDTLSILSLNISVSLPLCYVFTIQFRRIFVCGVQINGIWGRKSSSGSKSKHFV